MPGRYCERAVVRLKPACVIATALFSLPAHAQVECQAAGSATWCSNGVTYRASGATVRGSDGTVLRRSGDQVLTSDGRAYRQVGPVAYGSDGTQARRYGNVTYITDRDGNMLTCTHAGRNTRCQ